MRTRARSALTQLTRWSLAGLGLSIDHQATGVQMTISEKTADV